MITIKFLNKLYAIYANCVMVLQTINILMHPGEKSLPRLLKETFLTVHLICRLEVEKASLSIFIFNTWLSTQQIVGS